MEAAITDLPDESKDSVRTSAANLLWWCRLPSHKNTSTNERKAINELKKDKTWLVTKADKGNCFVVMDRNDYDKKMQDLLDNQQTYEKVSKSPFKRIESELKHSCCNLNTNKNSTKSLLHIWTAGQGITLWSLEYKLFKHNKARRNKTAHSLPKWWKETGYPCTDRNIF
jgi:hypothetical protein